MYGAVSREDLRCSEPRTLRLNSARLYSDFTGKGGETRLFTAVCGPLSLAVLHHPQLQLSVQNRNILADVHILAIFFNFKIFIIFPIVVQ